VRACFSVLGGVALYMALAVPSSAAEKIKLGMITKFPVDFFFTLENGAKEAARKDGNIELVTGQGASGTDIEGQIALIESMVSQGVKGIAITPVDATVASTLDKAVAAGVKVVLVDNDIPGWKGKTSYVGTDNFQGGVVAGKWLRERTKDGQKFGILEGVPGVPALDDRYKGMVKGLGDRKLNIVGKGATSCNLDGGVKVAEDILTANPDLEGIYAVCGPPAVGAIQALKNAKVDFGKFILVGFDACCGEIEALKAGQEDATVAQFPLKMGELGIVTAAAAVRGQKVDPVVDTGTAIVTKENADQFK
jgi:ABC-type sugar transport system substrate-binding protein